MKIVASSLAIVVWLGSATAIADEPRVFQATDVFAADPAIAAEGAAWLKRSEDRVDGRVMMQVESANEPYTIWWVIFNSPENCTPPSCGEDDVFNMSGGEEADVAVFNASGAISAARELLGQPAGPGNSNKWMEYALGGGVINVNISAIVGEGAGNGSQNGPIPPGMMETPPFFQRDLENAMCAEIHLDINRHTCDGACDWVAELTYPEGAQAFAVFEPPEECN
jgi:hypothetical protein